jgi:hypothetical protein
MTGSACCSNDQSLQQIRERLLLTQVTIHHHRFTMAASLSGINAQRLLVAFDAAKMGELTRLNEYQVESVAIEKRNYDEVGGKWELKSSDQINIGSSYIKCSMEAALQGLKKHLKPQTVANYDEDNKEEKEGEVVEEVVRVLRSSLLVTNFVDEQMEERLKSLLPEHILKKMGDMETLREKYSRDAIAALPSKTIPVYSAKAVYMTRSRLRIAVPEEAVKGSVARKRRLDESKYFRIRNTCDCVYCKMPSPFQTQGYRSLAKRQKQGADMKSVQPLNSEKENGSKGKWAPAAPYRNVTITPQTQKSMVSHQLGFWSLHSPLTLTGTSTKRSFKVSPKKSIQIRSTSMISPPTEKKSLPFTISTSMSTYPAIPKGDDSDSIPPPPPLLGETPTLSAPIPPSPSDDLSSSVSSRSTGHSFGEAGDNPIPLTPQTNRKIESSNPRVRVQELFDEYLKSPASTAQLWSPSPGDSLKSPATTTPKPEAKLETPDQKKRIVRMPSKSQTHPGREVTLTEISFVPMESDEVSAISSPVESARKSLAAARLKKKDFFKSTSKRMLKQRIGSEPMGSKSSHDPHRGREIHTDSLGAKTSHESRVESQRRGITPDPLGSKSGHGRLHYHKGRKSGQGPLTRSGGSRERSASRSRDERKPVDPPMAKLKPAALKRTWKDKQGNRNAMESIVTRTASLTSTGLYVQKEKEGTPVNRTAKDKEGYENPAERMDPRRRSATVHLLTETDIISQASECDSPPPAVAKSVSTDSAKLSRHSSHRGLDADVRRLRKGLPGSDVQKEQEGAPLTSERMGPIKRSSSVHSSTRIDIASQASEGASPPTIAKSWSTGSAKLRRQSSQRGLAADVRRPRKGSRKPVAKGQATEAGNFSPAQKMGRRRSSSLSNTRLVRKSSSRNIGEAQQKAEATADKMMPKSLSKTQSMRTIQVRASTSPVSPRLEEMASPLTTNARPDPPEEPKLKALNGHRHRKSSGALSKSRHVASSSPTKASQATRQESSNYSTNKKSSESPIPSRRKFFSESSRDWKFQSNRTLLDSLSSDSMHVRTPNTTKRQTIGDASFHGLLVDVLSSPTATIEVTRMPTSLSLASPHSKTTAEKHDLPSWVTPGYSAKGKIGKVPSRHQNGSLPISKGLL